MDFFLGILLALYFFLCVFVWFFLFLIRFFFLIGDFYDYFFYDFWYLEWGILIGWFSRTGIDFFFDIELNLIFRMEMIFWFFWLDGILIGIWDLFFLSWIFLRYYGFFLNFDFFCLYFFEIFFFFDFFFFLYWFFCIIFIYLDIFFV